MAMSVYLVEYQIYVLREEENELTKLLNDLDMLVSEYNKIMI